MSGNERICILYTGGTIGMRRGTRGYEPGPGLGELLPVALPSLLEDSVPAYEVVEYDRLIDSADAGYGDWTRIAADIAARYDRYAGFVVLHGTDTMAYAASALSFMLAGLRKPVIVTGSQIPLRESRNDARNNLLTALLLAAHHPVPEVCLYFNGRLLRGNRSTKVQAEGFDAFDSPNAPWLGEVGIRIQVDADEIRPAAATEAFEIHTDAQPAVAVLQVFPGMDGRLPKRVLDAGYRGLVLRSYGVGNAPAAGKGLLEALQQATAQGVVVVNVSQCLQGRVVAGQYATGAALADAGVIGGADMTTEAAFTKLAHLLAGGLQPVELGRLMAENLHGELTP